MWFQALKELSRPLLCKALCDLLKPSIQSKGQVGKPSNSIFPQSCYSFLSPDSPVTGSLLSTVLFPAPPRSLTRNSLNSSILSWADFQLLVMASCYTSKSFLPRSVCLRRAIWESRIHPKQAFPYSVDHRQANLLIKASSGSLGSTFKVAFRGHVWIASKDSLRIWFLLAATMYMFPLNNCSWFLKTKQNKSGVNCQKLESIHCICLMSGTPSAEEFSCPNTCLEGWLLSCSGLRQD